MFQIAVIDVFDSNKKYINTFAYSNEVVYENYGIPESQKECKLFLETCSIVYNVDPSDIHFVFTQYEFDGDIDIEEIKKLGSKLISNPRRSKRLASKKRKIELNKYNLPKDWKLIKNGNDSGESDVWRGPENTYTEAFRHLINYYRENHNYTDIIFETY